MVNLATEKDTGIIVAIKSVSREQVSSLGKERHIFREKELLNSLEHPTIIKLLKTFKDDQQLYFVFEHASNGTLDDFVKTCKNRIGEDLVKIQFAQMINFLEYMQQQGVMHRDLKPGNIMLDANYNIKIIDFGDAKRFNEESVSLSQISNENEMIHEESKQEDETSDEDDMEFDSDQESQ